MILTETKAAVAIVRTRGQDESILFIRRSERKEDSWSGHWSFPGGRRDPQDIDALHTALRELEEECGIRLAREQMEAALPIVVARRKTGPFVPVAPFVFGVDHELPTVLDPREVAASLWIPRSRLSDPAQHCLRPVPHRPGEMLFPAIALNDMPLWGFTYRLLTDWLDLGPKNPKDRQGEAAGFRAARLVLDFLLSRGLKLKQGWTNRLAQAGSAGQHVVKVATVEGTLPVELVLAHFGVPGNHVPLLNLLEVRADYIRVAGLDFEEYLISASK
jgi:8-oxo-dGTP pyrophosphatase MutT (NUDIX family)